MVTLEARKWCQTRLSTLPGQRRWGACRRHPRPINGCVTRALRCASGMPVGEVLVKGVPSAHSVARLAYPWSPWTPDRPCPAASLSPSRIHPAEPRRSRSPRRYSTPSEREHRISTRTPRLDNTLHPIPPVKVGQLSSQLREGRPTSADPGQFAWVSRPSPSEGARPTDQPGERDSGGFSTMCPPSTPGGGTFPPLNRRCGRRVGLTRRASPRRGVEQARWPRSARA